VAVVSFLDRPAMPPFEAGRSAEPATAEGRAVRTGR